MQSIKDMMPTNEPEHEAQIYTFPAAIDANHDGVTNLEQQAEPIEPHLNFAHRALRKVIGVIQDKLVQKESWGGDADHYGAHSRYHKLDR